MLFSRWWIKRLLLHFCIFLTAFASRIIAYNQLKFQNFSPSPNFPTMKKKQKTSICPIVRPRRIYNWSSNDRMWTELQQQTLGGHCHNHLPCLFYCNNATLQYIYTSLCMLNRYKIVHWRMSNYFLTKWLFLFLFHCWNVLWWAKVLKSELIICSYPRSKRQ